MISGVTADNYSTSAWIAGEKYDTPPTVGKGGASIGVYRKCWCSKRSAVIASTGGSKAYSNRSFVLGSGANSHSFGSRSGIINSLHSETDKSGHTQLILIVIELNLRATITLLLDMVLVVVLLHLTLNLI